MAKKSDNELNTKELSYAGCYGEVSAPESIGEFLQESFDLNYLAEKEGHERFSTCIWGGAGTGKTSLCKAFANKPVVWNGKQYKGYKVHDVPIAQFEEMGDLHGMPDRHVMMKSVDGIEHWVPEAVIPSYLADKWEIVREAGTRTMYAPPDWVPSEPGPTILLLDDWNRASIRIIKGIMQLLQNYGMVSWKLPPGCHIVMTGNPDQQDYLVSTVDSAILTRVRHITLKHDAPSWAVWATGKNLDPRGINFCLLYPEMMIGKERTNPRTLSEFFRYSKGISSLSDGTKDKENIAKFNRMANGLLDPETVTALNVYYSRDVELTVEPEQVFRGDVWATDHIKKMMTQKEKRMDILGVTMDRLFAKIVQPDTPCTPEWIKNFQKFICMEEIPDEPRYSICMRLARAKDGNGKNAKWVMGDKRLQQLLVNVL